MHRVGASVNVIWVTKQRPCNVVNMHTDVRRLQYYHAWLNWS